MYWKDEPKAIKVTLITAGFVVIRARKSTGTSRTWNNIKVEDKYNNWQKTYTEANRIAENLIGHDKVSISVM